MTAQEILNITQKAYAQGTFLSLFLAEEGYCVPPDPFFPADVPTDWSLMIQNGLYQLFETLSDRGIPSLCATDIRRMFRGDAYCVWCAYNVCFFMICCEQENRAPFAVIDGDMLRELRCTLLARKEDLIHSKIWLGQHSAQGLWGQIDASSQTLAERFGLQLNLSLTLTPTSRKMKEIVGGQLKNYFEKTRQETGAYPRSVRLQGMDSPHFTVEPGQFGNWQPEEASCAITLEQLTQIFGEPIHDELYGYYRFWRFAALEVKYGSLLCMMDPVFETHPNQTNFFFKLDLFGELYFKLGIAEKADQDYTVLFRNAGGVYLLAGGSRVPVQIAPDLQSFLTGGQ